MLPYHHVQVPGYIKIFLGADRLIYIQRFCDMDIYKVN